MILPILTYPNKTLTTPGDKIVEFSPELRRLISNMIETLEPAKGVGLAAQQVGHLLQVAVIDVRRQPEARDIEWGKGPKVNLAQWPLVLVNPVITPRGGPAYADFEGCLSFPASHGRVMRMRDIAVTAFDDYGLPLAFNATGTLARIIQHEVDHLNGVLFVDRMPTAYGNMIKRKFDPTQP